MYRAFCRFYYICPTNAQSCICWTEIIKQNKKPKMTGKKE